MRLVLSTTVVCAIALVAGTNFGLTATARADDMVSGTYAVITPGDSGSTWTIQSACAPGCVARVSSTEGWRGYAILRDNTWEMSVYHGDWLKSSYPVDIATCPASIDTTVVQNWSWAHDTLSGTLETIHGDQCGGPPSADQVPMRLVEEA
ncbi:hypothetical protein ASJ79_00110 [Mycobacterium sp. NAZ190054]|nr:hypothetical protein ASJ79_00110 [Mycobacterium sp. NAZ190054]